jgi:type I restriction enzyme, S subunit
MKYLVDLNARSLSENEDPGRVMRYVDISTVGRGTLVTEPVETTFVDAPSRARRLVQRGDTIVSTVRTYLRAIWPVNLDTDDLVVSTGFAVLGPRSGLEPRFLGWWCQSDVFVEEVVARSVGVSYPAINPSDLADIAMPLPPLGTQRAIADYLDAETARIDALIAKKRRLIELLDERNRAHIDHLIASSVNESRHVTLGQVMERLIDYRGATPVKSSAGVPLLTASNILDGRIDMDASRQFIDTSLYGEWMRRGLPQPGDLVLTTEAPLGEIALLDDVRVALAQRLILLRPRRDLVLPEYLFTYMRSGQGRRELLSRASGSTVMGIRTDRLRAMSVLVPSIRTQREIVAARRATDGRVGSGARLIRGQIDLLVEHRQALITAAVTGELEIQGVAA